MMPLPKHQRYGTGIASFFAGAEWQEVELDTPHGRMMATMLAAIVQFQCASFIEREKPSLVVARARGKKFRRQPSRLIQ